MTSEIEAALAYAQQPTKPLPGKSYYECHVTMVLAPLSDTLAPAWAQAETERLGWKFSQIEGDIALGAGVKSYATMHYNARTPMEDVLAHLNRVADSLDMGPYIKVIRRKVELVIYDDRSTKVAPGTCEGACVACHLDDYEERDAVLKRAESILRPYLNTAAVFGITPSHKFRNREMDPFHLRADLIEALIRKATPSDYHKE